MERAFVDWLSVRGPRHPLLKLGIGDDAAVLALADAEDVVVTTDLLADGTHFLADETDPKWIGRKCLAANLSDLAAMAAQPLAVVVSLLLPRDGAGRFDTAALARRLLEGMLPLAEEFNTPIAGGDTNVWAGRLAVNVTALGRVTSRGPLRRDGGQPGDRLLVTGELGGSIVGHHLDFTPRVREALALSEQHELHAGMDLTDGLAIDLDRLASASRVGAVIDLAHVPISAAASQLAMADGGEAIDHALADGEDFELLLATPPETAAAMLRRPLPACGLTDIGELVADAGLWQRDAEGQLETLTPTGYLHE